MIYRRVPTLLRFAPEALRRHILHFEASIEDAVREFSMSLPGGSRVLDAGAGECQYRPLLAQHQYVAVDLGIGDTDWSYSQLHAVADLQKLPFGGGVFDACLNVVTLEHMSDPFAVLAELTRVLKPRGRLLLITPLEWEEHQIPYDYFRYTRYGVELLLRKVGLEIDRIEPVGGYFRLLSRRLAVMPQFFPKPISFLALVLVAPVAMALSSLDRLDRTKAFTLGHICTARKP